MLIAVKLVQAQQGSGKGTHWTSICLPLADLCRMSWLRRKFLAPKPLKFPKTSIRTWILLSYAHILMHIFPKEIPTAFIYSFLHHPMVYKEISFQLPSGQLLQNNFLNILQLSERQLICIASLGIRAVYVLGWVSSWSPEHRASATKAWAPPPFRTCRVRHHNCESWFHLRTTCASGVPAHLPRKPSPAACLAKCPFTSPVWITFPFLRHLHWLFLGLPAEWFYYQTSSENRYNPSYSPPPLPPQKVGRKASVWWQITKNCSGSRTSWMATRLIHSAVLVSPHRSLIILQLEPGNPPY